jgi:hypothetical protein
MARRSAIRALLISTLEGMTIESQHHIGGATGLRHQLQSGEQLDVTWPHLTFIVEAQRTQFIDGTSRPGTQVRTPYVVRASYALRVGSAGAGAWEAVDSANDLAEDIGEAISNADDGTVSFLLTGLLVSGATAATVTIDITVDAHHSFLED